MEVCQQVYFIYFLRDFFTNYTQNIVLMKVKLLLICAVLLGMAQVVGAQTTDNSAPSIRRSINAELLGAYGIGGISFDSRFKADSKFGYKVGLGYGYGRTYYAPFLTENPKINEALGFVNQTVHQYLLPIQAYYLFGKNRHFFEVGAGVVPSLQFIKTDTKSYSKFNCFGVINAGYRYETNRWSIAPGADMGLFFPSGGAKLYPKISIGYRLQ